MATHQRVRINRDRPTIGVLAGWQVHAGTPDSFLHQVFRGIHAAAQDQNCNLLLSYSIGLPRGVGLGRPAWPLLTEGVDFVPVGAWNADGMIIAPPIAVPDQVSQYYERLQSQGYPLVAAGSGLSAPSIIPDNEYGIRQAMEHLVAHGHNQIAFIAGHDHRLDSDSASRLSAYQTFLQEYDLEQNPALVAYSAHTMPGGREAMQRILDSEAPFSAVVASNDLAALGAREVLHEAGLAVPNDIALIGFDDRIEARAMVPQLTTVHYPIFEVGYQSVMLLLARIQGEVEDDRTVRIPTRLVVRESCGCLPGEMRNPPLSDGAIYPMPIVEKLTEVVFNETHRLRLSEVHDLCDQMVAACRESLRQGNPNLFRQQMQKILDHVIAQEDSLQGWQAAISVLSEYMTELRASIAAAGAATCLSIRQIEDMLHQARIAISGMVQGQRARDMMRQSNQDYQLYQMTARFQTAQQETDIAQALRQALPGLGIEHATLARYEAEGADTVAWSILQIAPDGATAPRRFPTREFPPPGLYDPDRHFHLALMPLLFQRKELVGFVALDMGNLDLCADITWLLAAAFHGLELYRAAVRGQQLAEEANRLKSRFLSMVSHELRTPLNLISGLSDLLLRESLNRQSAEDVRLREDLERIYINAQHLDDLLRDVLDLARDEVGQLHLAHEAVNLHEVLEPVTVIARVLAHEKSLAWRTEISCELPWIWGDRTRLRQVLLNLVNNAVKFTTKGEIVLRVTKQDQMVRISVRDTGLGIPRDEQSTIFDEFRQSERTAARGYGGLGLGLAICRRLVELHGGQIAVQSSGAEGGGSEFFFTLPTIAEPEASIVQDHTQEKTHPILLLVRDFEGGRAIQAHWLRNGLELLLQCIKPNDDWLSNVLATSPGAVILDRHIAADRGWEIINTLKQHPQMRHVPVLLLGGDDVNNSALLELDFLTKPVGMTELGEALSAQGLLPHQTVAERTILVVDDDPESLALHTRIVQLQSPDYRILQARDGLEALDIIRQSPPDLVLLDLMMPGLDGFGVLKAMRQQQESRTIPVIILTAQTLTGEDMERLNRGIVSVLGKGLFSQEEIITHLKTLLVRQHKAMSEAQRFVLQAMAYIHTHYMEPISRSDIASHVGVSERHLTRCFRQEMGVSPSSYLNRYRVRQAKQLLDAGQMGITDVAMEVGFSSGGYFSRVFRQEMGVSPLAYQRGECASPSDQ